MISKFYVLYLFILIGLELGNDEMFEIDKNKIDLDKDSVDDIITIVSNKETNKITLIIYLSTNSLDIPSIINEKAIPNPIYDYLICDEVYVDSIGFNLLMMNTNGNNHHSKKFFFKRLNDDIVLYKIEEYHLTKSNFIQETFTIYFEYENLKEYDPIYSIKNFNFNDFW